MKATKIFAFLTALSLIAALLAVPASAATEVTVYVTISDGTLALAQEKIIVSDIDGDGAITINDALLAAHDAKYEGGAAAGYSAVSGDYGLGMHKLWGIENGQSYGYYLNNASAYNLTDVINDGDRVSAYAFTDLVAWSDTYCYFSEYTITAKQDEPFSVNLQMSSYDENWNPVTLPVENAEITIDGKPTGVKTDADGNASITFDSIGIFTVSAVSDTLNLVPTALIAEVFMGVIPVTAPAATVPSVTENPATSDSEIFVIICLAAISFTAFSILAPKKAKNEK